LYQIHRRRIVKARIRKYEKIDINISEWSREVLEMLISESVKQDVSVNDVICSILEEQFAKEENE
jgi:hypothetical protein